MTKHFLVFYNDGMGIIERQKELVEEMQEFESWKERYLHIIQLGKELPAFPEEHRRDENKVSGCQSQVWLHAELREGKIFFVADSDSVFVKGLIALLLEVYSDASPDEILQSSPEFLKTMGIAENLTPNRANGLGSMVAHIRAHAKRLSNQTD